MSPAIDAIEYFHYRIPLDPPFYASWDPKPRTSFSSHVVRIRAGEFEGVGPSEGLYGLAGNESLFLAQDPFAIERHVHILDNLQFHGGRLWSVEVALWDLMGQISGLPLWKLLGGRSGRVPLYASTGERRPISERVGSALALLAAGYPALKIRFHAYNPRDDLAVVRAVREAIGDQMELLVDANQGWQMPSDSSQPWDFKTALWMADALAELDVYWLEEPLHRHDYRGLADLRRRSGVRIAGGEGNREFSEQREYLRHRSLDVYQADVVWSTGILRGAQLAGEVQADSAVYSPHTWGDGLWMLANLQVAAAVSHAPFVEFPYDPPGWSVFRRDFILPHPLEPTEPGAITLPDRPGLGVTLDWKALERYRVK